jgi:acetyl-CoA acetyltransferase
MGSPEQLQDTLLLDGLTDPIAGGIMGELTERLISEYEIPRDKLDEIAHHSHMRATAGTQRGFF